MFTNMMNEKKTYQICQLKCATDDDVYILGQQDKSIFSKVKEWKLVLTFDNEGSLDDIYYIEREDKK